MPKAKQKNKEKKKVRLPCHKAAMPKILFSFQKARYLPNLAIHPIPYAPRKSSAKTSRKFLGRKGLLACCFSVDSLSTFMEFRNQDQSLQLHKVTWFGAKEDYNAHPLLIRLQKTQKNGRKAGKHTNT